MGYLRWIDTLDFQDHGQWKVDTQFTHLMGSSYLLACHTPGKPVQDATTRFAVPKMCIRDRRRTDYTIGAYHVGRDVQRSRVQMFRYW